MPPNPLPHLTAWFIEAGITEAAAMGNGPLKWREIVAWQIATGVHLAPWEAKLLRTLSLAYVAQHRKAEDETCPPPWASTVTRREAETELATLQMVLG